LASPQFLMFITFSVPYIFHKKRRIALPRKAAIDGKLSKLSKVHRILLLRNFVTSRHKIGVIRCAKDQMGPRDARARG